MICFVLDLGGLCLMKTVITEPRGTMQLARGKNALVSFSCRKKLKCGITIAYDAKIKKKSFCVCQVFHPSYQSSA